MVLDFLPYKVPKEPRRKIGWIRYITFAASLIFVAALFLAHVGSLERIMFWAFIIGNILYYTAGIILAFFFQGNPGILQVHLSDYCFSEADELFFSDSSEMR